MKQLRLQDSYKQDILERKIWADTDPEFIPNSNMLNSPFGMHPS